MIPSRQPWNLDPRQSSQSYIRYPSESPQFTGYRSSNPMHRGLVPKAPSSINYRPSLLTQSMPLNHEQNARSIQRFPMEPSVGQLPYRMSQPVSSSFSSKFPSSNSSNRLQDSPIQSSTDLPSERIHRNDVLYTSTQNPPVPPSNHPSKLPVSDLPVRFVNGSHVQRYGSDLRNFSPRDGQYVHGYPMPSRGVVASQGFSGQTLRGVPKFSTSATSGI